MKKKIALVGNPNCGKTSLFNALTGLRQKTGNFPGVTIDRKAGTASLDATTDVTVIDLPGTYSLYPKTLDEQVVLDILLDTENPDYPDAIITVVDASNLKRNLLVFSQIKDLGLPVVLALNMMDVAEAHGIEVQPEALSEALGVPVVCINAKTEEGLNNLRFALKGIFSEAISPPKTSKYAGLLLAIHADSLRFLSESQRKNLGKVREEITRDFPNSQANETLARYKELDGIVEAATVRNVERKNLSAKIDTVLLHGFWGYAIFFGILLLLFQGIFSFAQYPMDAIEAGFMALNNWLTSQLPAGPFTALLTDGLLAGIAGVVVFIPQIAILFLFISLLEESGYMARVMVLMDKLLRKVGLNGRSVVPLISGVACAVPAIMATRTIQSPKDRLITILVTPLMSCSARLPIYTIMVGLAVPDTAVLGIFTQQGVALFGLYILGFVAALVSAYVMKKLMKAKERSFFVMEMPVFQRPRFDHVLFAVWNAVRAFVLEAGRVIVAISIILWVLASYGPGNSLERAEAEVRAKPEISSETTENQVAAARLEASYAGRFGKAIEPAIRPLGYDWKIGIALLTSFAAREVFVGTMATIYSVGNTDETATVREKLRQEKDPATGEPRFSTPVAFSLLIFYAFAMMCMSTLATTYRETQSWQYPFIQFVYMTTLAYLAAWLTFRLLS